MLHRTIWVPSAIALVATVTAFALQPVRPPSMADLTTFTSQDKELVVVHPSNWVTHSMSIGGNSTEAFYQPSRDVYFSVSTDLAGSLMADISRAGSSSMANIDTSNMPSDMAHAFDTIKEKQKSPLQTVHEMKQAGLAKRFDGYEETTTQPARVAGQEALATDFTFQSRALFGTKKIVGRRYTALTNERELSVMYYCPKGDVGTLQPAFDRMVKSIRAGQGAGG